MLTGQFGILGKVSYDWKCLGVLRHISNAWLMAITALGLGVYTWFMACALVRLFGAGMSLDLGAGTLNWQLMKVTSLCWQPVVLGWRLGTILHEPGMTGLQKRRLHARSNSPSMNRHELGRLTRENHGAWWWSLCGLHSAPTQNSYQMELYLH